MLRVFSIEPDRKEEQHLDDLYTPKPDGEPDEPDDGEGDGDDQD